MYVKFGVIKFLIFNIFTLSKYDIVTSYNKNIRNFKEQIMKLRKKAEVLVLDENILNKENISKLEKLWVLGQISKSDCVIFNASLSDENKNLPLFLRITNIMKIQNFGVVSMPFKFEGKLKNEQAKTTLFKYIFDDIVIINSDDVIEEIAGKISLETAKTVVKDVVKKNTNIIKYYTENHLDYSELNDMLLFTNNKLNTI